MDKSFTNTFEKDIQIVNSSYEDFEEELKAYQIRKEIEKRNNFNPTFETEKGIPYLVDQHLLEKKDA